MLLIDFDKLMETYNDFYDEFTVYDLRFLKKKCLPIVEAIPVEWIEKQMAERENYGDFNTAGAIGYLLLSWEKENENR